MLQRYAILVVDDEPDVLEAMGSLLGLLPDCRVDLVPSLAEARKRVRAIPYDMVVSDERLPDGSGTAFLAEVAQQRRGTIRALMSAHGDFRMVVGSLNDARIHGFLPKPWDNDQVLAWIQRALAERRDVVAEPVATGGGFELQDAERIRPWRPRS